MKCNVTIYGPVHSGKSTLAGFITTYKKSEKELERMDHKIMDELGEKYDPAQKIAYYVDTAKDERRRDRETDSIGTSKHLHYIKISRENEGDLLLIDSPGSKQQWKKNYQSSFLGDVGILVYCVSSFDQLANLESGTQSYIREKNKLLWQIELWKKYKDINYLIIALSKMDGEDAQNKSYSRAHSRLLYSRAVTVINGDPELKNVPIIPIAIDVGDRLDHNIYSRSSLMEWYSGQTLMEVIEEKVKQFSLRENLLNYTFVSAVEKLRIKETKEPVFRIKVLSGEVKKGDCLTLTQVVENRATRYKTGSACVKSLKADAGEKTNVFTTGTIGGVTFNWIKIEGKAASVEDIELSRASYLIDSKMKTKEGNILCLKSQKDAEQFCEFKMQDKVNLLMFGKIVSTILVSRWFVDNVCYLNVYTKVYPLVLPICDNGQMAFPNYVIEKENMDFLSVQLLDMKMVGESGQSFLRVECNDFKEGDIEELRKVFSLSDSKNNFVDIEVTNENIERISSRLRFFFRQHSITDYSVRLLDAEYEKK